MSAYEINKQITIQFCDEYDEYNIKKSITLKYILQLFDLQVIFTDWVIMI